MNIFRQNILFDFRVQTLDREVLALRENSPAILKLVVREFFSNDFLSI